jgi:hypothetical protein
MKFKILLRYRKVNNTSLLLALKPVTGYNPKRIRNTGVQYTIPAFFNG